MLKENRACPKCRELGHDKGGDHLFLLSDGETYLCRTVYHPRIFYNDVDGTLIKREKDTTYVRESKEDVDNYPVVSFPLRGISKRTYEHFGVRYSVDEERGEPAYLHFPVENMEGSIVGYHRRGITSKTFSNSLGIKGEETQLFGNYEQAKFAVVTEGQLDALSIYQVLKEKYPSFEPCVYSTNSGTGDTKSILNTMEQLKRYEKVILCFDKDEPGDKLTIKIAKAIGSLAYIMDLEKYKDANEALQDGASKLIINSFFRAEVFRPSGVVSLKSIGPSILKPVEYGFSYPYKSLDTMTYGARLKEIITIASGPGAGKSTVINEFIQRLIFEHQQKVSVFSLEESPDITGKKIVGSILGKIIHLPDSKYTEAEVNGVIDRIGDYLHLYDSQGWKEWDDIEAVIRFQASLGITFFFIDPITALTAHLTAAAGNELLNRMSADLSSLVQSLNITVFLCSHLNNANSGAKDHGSGARVLGSQLTGSRALWRWSTSIFGLSRDQTSDDEEERNTVTFQVIKNRFSGMTGSFPLTFNSKTFKLEESEADLFTNTEGTGEGGEF